MLLKKGQLNYINNARCNVFTSVFIYNFTFIRTGAPNESDLTYWMFSYDFKSQNKEWVPEDKELLKRKQKRNTLIFILYINFFLIFITFTSFISHLLEVIVNIKRFSYPI